jgi:multidrug resistance efflux pump
VKTRLVTLAVAALMIAGGAFWIYRLGPEGRRRAAAPISVAAPQVIARVTPPNAPMTPPQAPAPAPDAPAAQVATAAAASAQDAATKDVPGPDAVPDWLAAPGRVEPISEEMRLGFDIAGKIRVVLVEEGDTVRQGQVLARLFADDLSARVEAAEKNLASLEATLEKVLAGSREMERKEAKAAVDEAKAVLDVARVENERRRQLLAKDVLAKEEADRARREYIVAGERLEAAKQHFHLVDDPSREEDVKKAMADVAEARAQLAEAQAQAEKASIRSPIDGVVLRKHRRAGEMVSIAFDTPVMTVGDISRLRVRADVDERDIGRLAVGQKAYCLAEAYGDRKFSGIVTRVAKILGKKNVHTNDPAEKNDTRILEALIDLDGTPPLPVGLRMDVFIITAPNGQETLPDYRP